MSIHDLLRGLGIFTTGSIVVTSVIGFIAKSIFNNWLDKNMEQYKLKIQSDNELFKSELHAKATEHQVKYSKLHEDRVIAIKELYKRLVNMESSLAILVSRVEYHGEDGKPEKARRFAENFNLAFDYYRVNKIYFSEDTCTIIDSLIEGLRDIWDDFVIYDLQNGLSKILEESMEQRKIWKQCSEKMINEVPVIKKDLENEFRELLGVS